jgi:pimeloyl-ACP methyl ester carboxylesterase
MVALTGQGFRCVVYDRRSHGRSSDPGRGYDYDTLADDLAVFVERFDLRHVTLVGHFDGRRRGRLVSVPARGALGLSGRPGGRDAVFYGEGGWPSGGSGPAGFRCFARRFERGPREVARRQLGVVLAADDVPR